PARRRLVGAQAGHLGPSRASVTGGEQRRVLDARIDHLGVTQRGLDVPNALELPRVRRAVVPGMRARGAFVLEVVAGGFPGLAPVVGPWQHLTEPPARFRALEPFGVARATL